MGFSMFDGVIGGPQDEVRTFLSFIGLDCVQEPLRLYSYILCSIKH